MIKEKLLTKTQKEFQYSVFEIVRHLQKSNGYIKGYGSKLDRVMTENHSPIVNINHSISECLKFNALIAPDGLVQRPTVKLFALKSASEIKLCFT